MNQAGSENKCSKRVSNECILNNYNFDDVSTDQNSICENCKQRGWSVCGKHSSHVGTVSNTEHVVEDGEVSQQQQTGTNYLCHQSLLQKAWVYLQSVITSPMSGCPSCNPKPPPSPSVESPSQSSILSFLSSVSSPSPSTTRLSCQKSNLSCMTSCSRVRSPCQSRPRSLSLSRKSRPSCSRAKPAPPCPNVKPPSPKAKRTHPKPNAKPSCLNLQAPCPYAIPTCPNATCPSAELSCPSLQPPCPHAKPPSPKAKPPSPKAKQPSPKAMPSCPHAKPLCPNAKCPNAKCPNAELSCPSLQPPCPHAKPPSPKDKPPSPKAIPPCPYAIPTCPNATSLSAEVSCPSLQPPCPHAKPPSPKAKPPSPKAIPPCPYAMPPCPHAKPLCPNTECPNAKPSCPSLQAPCPKPKPSNTKIRNRSNSKTSLYHSFSNDSLSSICKESLVGLAKVYLQKMASDHKIRCPRCSKRPTCCANSEESKTSYLRSVFDQAWGYFNTSTEKKTCLPQRTLSNCSNTSSSSRIPKSATPTSKCCCAGTKPKSSKTQSCESVCCHKSVSRPKSDICPTCLTPATSTKPVTCPRPDSGSTCIKSDTKCYYCEGTTSPAQISEEVGTHEHKSCYTPCCMHNSQGVQLSHIMSDKSCWSSQTSVNPLSNRSRQIKPPQSVEELKASITGVTCFNKSSGNIPGCEIMDVRSTMINSKPYVQDLKVSKDSICSTDIPSPKLCSSLTMEQKYHKFGSHPKECKHSKESLDNCEETMSPCNDLEEQTCKEEASCPSSGGCAKSDEALLDKDFGSTPREQMHSKEKICKSGRNSVTSVDSNHSDRKDCNAPEKDVHGKDPYDYRYYY